MTSHGLEGIMNTDGAAEPIEDPGESPIVRATRLGQIKLVRILLEGGANINDHNDKKQCLLSIAVLSETLEYPSLRDRLVLYLTSRGADVNNRDVYGRTPLIHACKSKAGLSVINILLHCGARSSERDRFGDSALDYAKKLENGEAIQQLISSYEELNRTECNNNAGGSGGSGRGAGLFRRESSGEKYNLSTVMDLGSTANLSVTSGERSAEFGDALCAKCAPHHRQNSRSLTSVPEGDCKNPATAEKPTPRVKHNKVLRRRHTTDDLYSKQKMTSGPHTLPSYLMDQRAHQTTTEAMQDLNEVYLEEKSSGKSREHVLSWLEGISPSTESCFPTPPQGSDGQVQSLGSRLSRVCSLDDPTPSTSRAYQSDPLDPEEAAPGSRRQHPGLRRQGSKTQLVAELSYTRPGTLPTLKINPPQVNPGTRDFNWLRSDDMCN